MSLSFKDAFSPQASTHLAPLPSDNAKWLLEQRYFLPMYRGEGQIGKEDSFSLFANRIARIIASAETENIPYPIKNAKKEDEWLRTLEKSIYNDIVSKSFLFNSPCLFGAGAGLTQDPQYAKILTLPRSVMCLGHYSALRTAKTSNQQLFACFVIDVEDDIHNIFDSVKDAAIISKFGGGVGCDFGNLRERGETINGGTGGNASGPVSFMELWNTMGSVVVQGGKRRAALMGILPDNHPDIFEFMDAKTQDGKLAYFNISVSVSDKLLQAVEENKGFSLLTRGNREQRIKRTVPAQELWDTLCANAWKRGDPGVFFIDTSNQDSLLKLDKQWQIKSTNPCVTGDTWVLTSEGPRQVTTLVGNKDCTLVINGKEYPSSGFFSTGVKPVYELKTKEGHSLKLTKDHKVLKATKVTRNNIETSWVEAQSLEAGDRIVLHNHSDFVGWQGKYTHSEGYLLGILLGDGFLAPHRAVLSIWDVDGEIGSQAIRDVAFKYAKTLPHRSDFRGWAQIKGEKEFRLTSVAIKNLAHSLGMTAQNRNITPDMESMTSSDFYIGFLRGFFDTDGSVQGSTEKGVSIRLSQSNLPALQAVQRMLARLGIQSTIYTNRRKAGARPLPDGKGGLKSYYCHAQHELAISKDSMIKYAKIIGFEHTEKRNTLETLLGGYKRKLNAERFLAEVESFTPNGKEEVFDVTVPDVHAFDANGLYVHNCGEQNLPSYTSCNLGSINLKAFVRDPDSNTNFPFFDFEGFQQQVIRAMYYLDLVIDASAYPLQKIEERTKAIRPVGLGIMGLADAAIMLGIKYGSPQFKEFCEKIATILSGTALWASINLVEEVKKSAFPAAPLVKDLMNKFLVEDCWESATFYNPDIEYDELKEHLEEMENTDTIPYTLKNTLQKILESNYFGDSEEERTKFCLQLLRALAKGKIRNSRRLSIAPTGSISMLLDTSAGIEPNFAWHWSRKIANTSGEGTTTRQYWHNLLSTSQREELQQTGTLKSPCFVTAHDVPPEAHVEVTGVFAQVVDSGISKTVNLPESATIEDVKEVYKIAYKQKMKGITIYRDGSRAFQPIEAKKPEKEEEKAPATIPSSVVKERPGPIIFGKTMKETTPWGSLYVTLNLDKTSPFEVFATVGKSGSELKAMTEALSRVISIGLRSGGKIEDFIRTLKGLSGKESWMLENDEEAIIRSIPDAIAHVMEKLTGREEGGENKEMGHTSVEGQGQTCPECGTPMEILTGCAYCFSCGYSPCK